jgi:hypothetical protein
MGSTLGLYHFFKNNHEPIVIAPNEFPDFLAWLPGSETVKIFEKTKLHRNTGGSRSNFHVGLQCFAPRGWSDGSCFMK